MPPSVDLVFFDFCHFGPCDVQEPECIYIYNSPGAGMDVTELQSFELWCT